MNNEQCIAVAEKVWGLSCDGILDEYNRYLACVEYQTDFTKEEWLKEEINSWSGFGRTLEKSINPSSIWKFTTILREYLDGSLTKEQFIEATHLVALEAVRKEKEDVEV